MRDSRKQSCTGWDDTLFMIIAEPVIWDKLIKDHPRVKKFRSKPFMLFKTLASLHEEKAKVLWLFKCPMYKRFSSIPRTQA
ncbi:hypothetical protein ACQJBY_058130 [Aegilops geniculata]